MDTLSKYSVHITGNTILNGPYVGDMLLQKTYSTDTMPIHKKVNKGEKTKYLVKGSHRHGLIHRRSRQCFHRMGEQWTADIVLKKEFQEPV